MKLPTNAFGTIAISAIFLFSGCTKNDDDQPAVTSDNLVAVAREEGDLKLFVEALEKTELTGQLSQGSYTVFAPVDSVFQIYLNNLQVANIDGWINAYGPGLVRNILLYHIIKGAAIEAQQIGSSYINSSATNKRGHNLSLYTSRMDTVVKLNSRAQLTQINLKADNGILHKTNAVLVLPSIINLLEANTSFTSLLSALNSASGNLTTILRQENEDFSLFAPVNTAFLDLYNNHPGYSQFTGFVQHHGAEELRNIMLYHLLNNSIRSEKLTSRSYSTKFAGYSFDLTKETNGHISITDNTGNKASVLMTDITAMNGVIHSIDYVLFPR